ncbi:DMT family transporter [Desulfurococcus amylolyticus]|uniref:DMT family transporter n=1 Tax=Desulfurococcus amylolyticus TaxID=94694 RepID=UPI0023F2BFCB|nr:DMT family transporter [Desulfurococcus amylolyticus]
MGSTGMLTGLIYLSISILMWSITPSLIAMDKARYNSFTANGLRALLAGLITLPFTARAIFMDLYRYLVAGAVIGTTGILIGDSLYILSIRRLGPGLAVIICYTYVITTQLLKQLIEPGAGIYVMLLAALLAIVGVYITVRRQVTVLTMNKTGLLAALITNISWAVWSLLSWIYIRHMGLDVLALTTTRLIIPGLILLAYSSRIYTLRELLTEAPRRLKFTMITGVTGYIIGGTAYLESMRYLNVAQATIATSLVPVLNQLISSKVSGKGIMMEEVAGTILVGVSIALSTLYGG